MIIYVYIYTHNYIGESKNGSVEHCQKHSPLRSSQDVLRVGGRGRPERIFTGRETTRFLGASPMDGDHTQILWWIMPYHAHTNEDLGNCNPLIFHPQIHWLTIICSHISSFRFVIGIPPSPHPVVIRNPWWLGEPPHSKRPGDVDKLRSLVALAFSDQAADPGV